MLAEVGSIAVTFDIHTYMAALSESMDYVF